MATLNQYGLLLAEDPNKPTTSAQGSSTPGAPDAPLANPFSNAPAVNAAGAQVALPSIQQYAFNPRYSALDQALQARLADAGLDRGNAIGALNQNYQVQTQDAGRQREKAINQLTDRFAGQGLMFSGINAGAQGDLQGDFQRYMGGLATGRANSLADIERGYGGIIRDVNQQRGGMYAQQGQEEEAARLASAQQAQQAQQAQLQAQALQQMQQQMLAAQQAALAAPAGPSYSAPTAHSAGAPGGAGGAGDVGSNDPALLGMINTSEDWNFLNSLSMAPQLTPQMKEAITNRIKQLTAAGTAQQKATGNYQRTKAY